MTLGRAPFRSVSVRKIALEEARHVLFSWASEQLIAELNLIP